MMTLLSFFPLILITLFMIFGGWLIISDFMENPEKPKQDS